MRGDERCHEFVIGRSNGGLARRVRSFGGCGVFVAVALMLPACEETCSLAIVEPRAEDAGLTLRTSIEPLQRFAWTIDVELVAGLADGTEAIVSDLRVMDDDVLDLTTTDANAYVRFFGETSLPGGQFALVTLVYPTLDDPGDVRRGVDDQLEVHAWVEQYGVNRLPDPVPLAMRVTASRVDGQRRLACITPRVSNADYEVTPAWDSCGDRWWFWSRDTTCEWQLVP